MNHNKAHCAAALNFLDTKLRKYGLANLIPGQQLKAGWTLFFVTGLHPDLGDHTEG
jgi:hypothetical protein